MIQGLILAAGKGRRLGSLLNGKPKGLLQVGDRSLIEHHVDALQACGVEHIAVVIGYGADYVRAALGDRCHFIENPRFASTNSLYSLWLARHWVRSAFVMVNSDVLADLQIYRRVVGHLGSALAYDSTSGTDAEEMKISLRNGCIGAISKIMAPEEAHGESIGMIKFDHAAAPKVFAAASQIIERGSVNDWSPAAVAAIAPHERISGIDIAGLPWTEIDFPEDLQHARSDVIRRIRLPDSKQRPEPVDPLAKHAVLNGSSTVASKVQG